MWGNDRNDRVLTEFPVRVAPSVTLGSQEVNLGVRHIYRDPSNIWDNSRFADEFRDDHLEWPSETSYSDRHGTRKHRRE